MRTLTIALLLLVLTACTTLEVGIERTPTPDRAEPATVAALQTDNAHLAGTAVAMTSATPGPTETVLPPPTSTVPPYLPPAPRPTIDPAQAAAWCPATVSCQ